MRRWKGSGLALVLVALVALKHAALGFCLCSDQFFLSDCDCSQVAPAACACDDCPATPCDDCVVVVSVDIDDFLWATDPFAPKEQASIDLAPPATPFADFTRGTALASTAMPIRGSPPGTPPLYLLTSVLRL
ncbi:MAG: hypothetical protein HKN82_04810 [Akkermansiaceae bacterium]|nr:hypothetical protein [Akkermansiaceae bacterium]NNM28797.1 hypothetical protein [Akkermansiaceae bacterium]